MAQIWCCRKAHFKSVKICIEVRDIISQNSAHVFLSTSPLFVKNKIINLFFYFPTAELWLLFLLEPELSKLSPSTVMANFTHMGGDFFCKIIKCAQLTYQPFCRDKSESAIISFSIF